MSMGSSAVHVSAGPDVAKISAQNATVRMLNTAPYPTASAIRYSSLGLGYLKYCPKNSPPPKKKMAPKDQLEETGNYFQKGRCASRCAITLFEFPVGDRDLQTGRARAVFS